MLKDEENGTANSNRLADQAVALEREALRSRLRMTYEERIEAHENARMLMEDLKTAGNILRAKPQRVT